MTEERKEYMQSWRKEHEEEIKTYQKAYQKIYRKEHRAEAKVYQKIYNKKHKGKKKVYNRDYIKSYRCIETNSTKDKIRTRSRYYLFTTLKHSKLKGYEIHHCFGYDDYKCFIYIPKELHLQIHQFLRDSGISADSNHFSQIVHLINAWEGYTYIKV